MGMGEVVSVVRMERFCVLVVVGVVRGDAVSVFTVVMLARRASRGSGGVVG